MARATTTEPVEVRNRFDGGWSRGYDIDEVVLSDAEPRYRVRRRSDGALLPALFRPDELRPGDAEAFVVEWALGPDS